MSAAVIAVRECIPDIVQALNGDFDTVWKEQDRGFVPPISRTRFTTAITRWVTGAYDLIHRTIVVSGANMMIYGISGYKNFRIEVRAEAEAQDNDIISFNPMDTLMNGLRAQKGRDLLKECGITLIDFEGDGAINVDALTDDRMRSHSILEMNMRIAFCVEEEPNDCWIQRTLVSSGVMNIDGSVLPVPPNVVDLLIDGGNAP